PENGVDFAGHYLRRRSLILCLNFLQFLAAEGFCWVGHQLVDELTFQGEVECLQRQIRPRTTAKAKGVDSDDLAVFVEQGSATVARVEGDRYLEKAGPQLLTAHCRDDAIGQRAAQYPALRVARMPNGEDLLADLGLVPRRGQSHRFDTELVYLHGRSTH